MVSNDVLSTNAVTTASEQRILPGHDALLSTRNGALSTNGDTFPVIQGALFWLIIKPFQHVTKLGLLAREYALPTNDTALMINDNVVTLQTSFLISHDHPIPAYDKNSSPR